MTKDGMPVRKRPVGEDAQRRQNMQKRPANPQARPAGSRPVNPAEKSIPKRRPPQE